MRILVVDDHQVVRRGIRSLLESAKDVEVCGEAVDGRDAIAKTVEQKPDTIIMDISMPNLDGIEATRRITDLFPATHVVILSQHDFPHIMRQALNAGASAYVVKSSVTTDLITAIDKIREGEKTGVPAVFGSTQRNVDVQEILRRSAALETALRESEERFRLTFEQAGVGIAHVAEDGRWLRVNQKICDILGYPQAELIRLRFQEITHPADLAADIREAARLARGEITQYSLEKRYIRKDREVVWCQSTTAAVYDTDQKLKYFVRVVEDITARKQAEERLRASEHELARENADLKLLQEISTELIREEDSQALYERIADAAVAMMRSDFASMQLLESQPGNTGELLLLAFRGFSAASAQLWKRISAGAGTSCAAALRAGKRVIVPDIDECEVITRPEDRGAYRDAGIRAMQSTPLLSRTGQIVGMISTHWRQVHAPAERELRMFDVLARQAADLIERRQTEEALRQVQDQLRAGSAHGRKGASGGGRGATTGPT